jgi:hypothetical protein
VTTTFYPAANDAVPPTGPHATSVAATSVSFASATTIPSTLSHTHSSVAPSTSYSYTVDAFDRADHHSPPSTAVPVTTPARSPAFVHGVADSPGTRASSAKITLSGPVAQGDLLVGWFAQYDAPGPVAVSDNVTAGRQNAPFTLAASMDWYPALATLRSA